MLTTCFAVPPILSAIVAQFRSMATPRLAELKLLPVASNSMGDDPFAAPFGGTGDDPFAAPPGGMGDDPFAAPPGGMDDDPFAAPPGGMDDDPFAAPPGGFISS